MSGNLFEINDWFEYEPSSILNTNYNFNLKSNPILDDAYHATNNVKDYKVILCSRNEIAQFVEYWHYSKNVNGLTIDYCFKLIDTNNNIIGAMIYGKIAMANVWKRYVNSVCDIIELKRLCCIDNTPKNTESFFIAHTLRWLKKNTEFKKVISYADTTYSHKGTIYKATNFKHIGMTNSGRVIIHNGKRYHDKSIRTKYKDGLKPFAIEIKKSIESGDSYYVDTLGKHIYIYEL